MSSSSYQILQLVDSQVEKFRTRKPVEGSLALARQHYEEAGNVEAAGPYEAWMMLRNGAVELPREFGVGDVLETEGSAPLVCNYWGIEMASWKNQVNRFAKLRNPYSVVCYLSGDLARFVSDLRRELNGCDVKPHLTVLPPRELEADQSKLIEEFQRLARAHTEPFFLRVGGVAVFEKTQVIKLDLASETDANKMAALHDSMSSEFFEQVEAYEYDPHITLSMEADPTDPTRTQEFLELARKRWAEFQGSREIAVETLSFVRQADDCSWSDLAEVAIGQPVAAMA